MWCWRRLLRVPWTARRSNQPILKEISPWCSLEGLMLKLKLQYFGHLMRELTHWKRLWCWEGLGAREGDGRGWDGWMASLTRWMWVWVNSGSWWWTGRPDILQFMGSQRVGHDWVTELNWTELNYVCRADKGPSSQTYGFSSSHVWMWELDHKEIWALKNWCFWTVVLEKTLESPLNCKEIKPVNHKGNQPWVFILRTDAEAEAPVLWPPDAKSQLTGKNLDARKDWGQKEKGATEDEMVGWHHWLNGHEFKETPGDSEGQGSLAWQSMASQRVGHNLSTEQQQTLKCGAHLSCLLEDTYSIFIWLAQKQKCI